jgi:hypothetical protein
MGKGSWSLIGWTWSWRSSLLSLASVALVGASPLSAKQPLAGSYLRHPAPAFHGGNASRLLAQPALPAKPVLLSSSRGDSWDACRQIAQPVACPISHPHDKPDQIKTSFITPYGAYCYVTMSFGLKNAGASYQQTMQRCLQEQIG